MSLKKIDGGSLAKNLFVHRKNGLMNANTQVDTKNLYNPLNTTISFKMADFIIQNSTLGMALLDYLGGDIEAAKQKMMESYQGVFQNTLEFTYYYIAKIDPTPCYLEGYIDYKRVTEDLFEDDFFALTVEGKTHVFKRHE